MSLNVFEIRNYTLQPHMREHFIDYFETNFITSQTAVNMHVLGQFRLLGQPDHYVWLRGFDNMQSRLDGLMAFYDGPYWKQHRNTTNSMIIDSDNVHLLRPLDTELDLTCGQTAKKVTASIADATVSPDTGLIAIDIYQAVAGQRQALIDAFQKHVIPLYQREGVQLRGIFVAEMSENEFPRLPAFQNENELVVITAYPTEEVGQATHARLAPVIAQTFSASLDGAPESLLLTPTLRSPLRYQSDFLGV